MCQKYPGPRCTPHVRARLDRARRRLDAAQTLFDANPAITRNRQRLDTAKTNLDARSAEYDATPGGQTELRTQLGTEDDPGKREKLQHRLETGKALREQQIRATTGFFHNDPKDNSNGHERDADPDAGRARSVLASVGMEPGVARSRALGDRAGVARHGDRIGEVPRLLIDDRHITPVAVHRLQDERAQRLRSLGESTPELYELHPRDAATYRRQMETLREGNRFAASVYVYSDDEYAGMRLLVTDDGRSGIALNGDEIVSLYAHRDSSHPGAANSMLETAVAAGGRRLDCFDTVLPAIYAKSGFVPVARLRWNDDYAPDDWDYNTYAAFNGGRPDVVFMAHDPASADSRYQRGSGRYVDSYDDGIGAVRARLGR
ncbi:GIY-YIG nuclease family protein [Rhodococcus qingshengii]|uniref:GIY-YIG nuclease family protein n=1 Tax=Rhodococcus qingshengii TaxID=334542 RepID=UPI0033E9499C